MSLLCSCVKPIKLEIQQTEDSLHMYASTTNNNIFAVRPISVQEDICINNVDYSFETNTIGYGQCFILEDNGLFCISGALDNNISKANYRTQDQTLHIQLPKFYIQDIQNALPDQIR